MDIYCPRCAEPTDMDYVHDVVAARHADGDTAASFMSVYTDYIRRGCPAIDGRCNSEPIEDDETMADIRATYDIIGHDPDGCASMLDDVVSGRW